jgi:hypothetical protein
MKTMKTIKATLFTTLIALIFTGCYVNGKCPTTNKRYFTKGIKQGKPLYKGYGRRR